MRRFRSFVLAAGISKILIKRHCVPHLRYDGAKFTSSQGPRSCPSIQKVDVARATLPRRPPAPASALDDIGRFAGSPCRLGPGFRVPQLAQYLRAEPRDRTPRGRGYRKKGSGYIIMMIPRHQPHNAKRGRAGGTGGGYPCVQIHSPGASHNRFRAVQSSGHDSMSTGRVVCPEAGDLNSKWRAGAYAGSHAGGCVGSNVLCRGTLHVPFLARASHLRL